MVRNSSGFPLTIRVEPLEIPTRGYFCKRFGGQVPNLLYHKVYSFNLADSSKFPINLVGRQNYMGDCNTSYLPKSIYLCWI